MLFPVLFLAAAVLVFGHQTWRRVVSQPIRAAVVWLHDWPAQTPFDRRQRNDGPVVRHQWSDGTMTEAAPGLSHPDFNFSIGSVHKIRYFPDNKGNVVLPGVHTGWRRRLSRGSGRCSWSRRLGPRPG